MFEFLQEMEKKGLADKTIQAYKMDLNTLFGFMEVEGIKDLDLETIRKYKTWLYEKYKPNSASRKLIICNKYFYWKTGIKSEITPTKVQRQLKDFMTKNDYERIMRQVEKADDKRTKAMMETLAYTGLRYSELKFVTVEALKKKMIEVNNKGTIRQIPILDFLAKDLKTYLKETDITTGLIFQTSNGKMVDATHFWRSIKRYTGLARVKKDKVSAHQLRHLFAKNYLELEGTSVLDLADLLGHKDLATTRIYTEKSVKEHRSTLAQMNKMGGKK